MLILFILIEYSSQITKLNINLLRFTGVNRDKFLLLQEWRHGEYKWAVTYSNYQKLFKFVNFEIEFYKFRYKFNILLFKICNFLLNGEH